MLMIELAFPACKKRTLQHVVSWRHILVCGVTADRMEAQKPELDPISYIIFLLISTFF